MFVLTMSMAVHRTVSVAVSVGVPAIMDVSTVVHRAVGMMVGVAVIGGAMLVGATLDRRFAFAATANGTHAHLSRTFIQAIPPDQQDGDSSPAWSTPG